ncbi:MAG: epoxyqueuosine reductase [Candidatus Lokiarchaeota archaeon]|nr:epoxyqueuosine reductase [Candidatus Lokiarchaeota archaeon]
MEDQRLIETENLKKHIKKLGVDIYGIADMQLLKKIETGLPTDMNDFIKMFPYAIVLGAQYGKLGKKASGGKTAFFLEEVAFSIMEYLEERGYRQLIIHTEDEFDPIRRLGFMSLKILAKTAGLGWQGRSLLIISREYGPLHRLIAILTDLPLQTNQIIENECGTCRICIDSCPKNALTFVNFNDHPSRREDVLNINSCLGDNGCMACILPCPWLKKLT